jgi:hypothetical protein
VNTANTTSAAQRPESSAVESLESTGHSTLVTAPSVTGASSTSLNPTAYLEARRADDSTSFLQTPNAESPWGNMHRYHDLTHEIAFDPACLAHVLRVEGFTQFEAREVGPVAHRLVSGARLALWRLIHAGLGFWNLIETGDPGSGVFTRVFVASAVKPSLSTETAGPTLGHFRTT